LFPKEELYKKTGIQCMQLNTLYQLMAHQETHPEDFEDSTMLFIPDALTYMLCGKKSCEYSEASTSNLLDARKRDWDFEIIEKLGLPRSVFPKIEMPSTKAGTLTEDLRKEFACGPVPVIHAGSHDTASAVASVPAPTNRQWAYISCGTWALLGAEIDSPNLTMEAMNADFTNEGGLDGKIRFLTNIMGTWLFQEIRRVWNEAGRGLSYADMENMAKSAPALKFFVNPNDQRFFTPGNMPENIKEACRASGQGEINDDAAVLRCVYDSLALCFRQKLEKLQDVLGVKYECLNIVGGATKDRFLMRLTADALGIPVVAGPVEATSIGNITAQALASGDMENLSLAREMIKNSFEIIEFKPVTADKAGWDRAYEKFNEFV
jgi:sugar (pentulose or hexulose) kinase